MDVDHLYDFYQWYIKGRSNRVHIFLHAWEYSAVGVVTLAAIFFHPLLLAIVLGHLGHVATDHFHNRLSPFSYFITYRIVKRFDTKLIAPNHDVMRTYKGWPRLIPFGQRLEPWFRRNIEPWFEERIKRAASIQGGSSRSGD